MYLYEGANVKEELDKAQNAIKELGGEIEKVVIFIYQIMIMKEI